MTVSIDIRPRKNAARLAWPAFTAALAISAAAGCSSTTEGTGTLNGGIGAICTTARDCASGEICRSDSTEWIAHHQCTLVCDKDEDCTGQYGPHTMCIGANVCVSKCLDDSNCPKGTVCNEFGWCGNTGPGSGVPTCTGTPAACSTLSSSDCAITSGCMKTGHCTGRITRCYSWVSEYACSSDSECEWNRTCTGTQTETSCPKISASLCQFTPGCSLTQQ